MCGRYAASRKPEALVDTFGVDRWDPAESLVPDYPDYNVAPTKSVYAVLERPDRRAGFPESAGTGDPGDPVRQLRVLRWGLVPSWSRTPEGGARMINARAETVHEKPAYRRAFAARRCLVPADGYYEWMTGAAERELEEKGRKKRPRKQPYFVTPVDGSVMAMAGLFEFWRDRTLPDDHPRAWWVTCSVLTTEAETTPLPGPRHEDGPRTLADIHPRMPLALPQDRWDAWLDPRTTEPETLRGLLTPPPPGGVRAYPVSTEVSNVRNNGPELLKELEAPEEGTLF
ncbi:SOS response-associated peptidase [Streptomyces zingiberis]|uniref:Abasic site processing protein n=1 Tax=Streptomyces zingiberis TaxID=2053010 RepID=A0ABX1BT87_9ACTN|nr:SOS response-associated peptidase [Streptomyces zingiberis]NJQ00921.1 SOS response-associated peptidase [Streptomyces zingiberis]